MAERKLHLWFKAGGRCGDQCGSSCGCSSQSCDSCNQPFPNCNSCDGLILLPYNQAVLAPPNRYIIAAIVEGPVQCDGRVRYTVAFDDSVLDDPAGPLPQSDFRICCYDCQARFAELAATFDVLDTNTVDLSIGADTLQANAIISPNANNTLQALPNGLFASQTQISPVDTSTVNLTATGTQNHTIQADVNVSAAPGNVLTVNADGLFVSANAGSDSLVDNGNRTFTHTDVNGNPVSFCQGIQTITPGTGCFGIGAQNMLRAAVLNGCDLQLSSAPEHTGHAIGGPSNTFVGNVLDPIVFNWVNPSACRSAIVLLFTNQGVTYVQQSTNANPILEAEFSPGGGFVGIQNLPAVNGAIFQGNVGVQDTEFFIVPPGGTLNVYRRYRISDGTGAPFPGLAIGTWAAAIRAVGWTI